MTFAWQSGGRFRAMRMIWPETNYNEPKYELVKWRKPSIRRMPRVWLFSPCRGESRIESDREQRKRFPGLTGHWPHNRKKRRVK